MIKRVVAAVLITALLSSCFVSCSSSSQTATKEPRYVDSDIWWNDSIVIPDLSKYPDAQMLSRIDVATGDYYIADIYCADRTVLCKFDYEGNLLGSIVPDKDMSVNRVSISDGIVYVLVYGTDPVSGSRGQLLCTADFDKGTLNDPEKISIPQGSGTDTQIDEVWMWQGKKVMSVSSDPKDYIVIDDGGKYTEYEPDLGDAIGDTQIQRMKTDGDKLYFEIAGMKGDDYVLFLCSLDLNTLEYHQKEMMHYMSEGRTVPQHGTYYVKHEHERNHTSVVRYNPATDDIEEILKFNDTYISNEYGLSENYNVLYADDTKVRIVCENESNVAGNGLPVVITLTKAESNPNKGRQILELAGLNISSNRIFAAVNRYNRENDKYFIEVTDRYVNYEDRDEPVYRLMEDIKGGTGPDMVLMNSDYAVLNDDQYLRKMTDDTGDTGQKYRIDYYRTYRGLMVRTNLLSDPDSPGITYEEYADLVKKANYGINPLGESRIAVFNNLFKFSAESFFDDNGNITLDNEDFRALAGYVRDMPEPRENYITETIPLSDSSWYGLDGLFRSGDKVFGEYSVIGCPSRLGDKPEIIDSTGIAITACTGSYDACLGFAGSLSDPAIQNRICEYGYDPSSPEGMRIRAENDINAFLLWEPQKFDVQYYTQYAGKDKLNGVVDRYISQVSDARYVRDVDTTVMKILDEEMEPYLAGQKEVDEVISVAENRIGLMCKER